MLTPSAPQLLHVVGYLTGIALYAMLLAMVVRAHASGDRITIGTALLGLAWNVGEMCALVCRSAGLHAAERWSEAASYAALGFLAAVVVHSVARGSASIEPRGSLRRYMTPIAYACAGVASFVQFATAATAGSLPSSVALALVTGGLVVLAPALILSTGTQATDRRALWMIALAIFAVSAVHLGRFHGANESWATELVGHHASIPLAFAILYQDYRFGFADLFLKQALTLLVLVVIVFATWSTLSPSMTTGAPSSVAVGTLLTCWVATAVAFPWIRRAITTFVDRVVLARADYAVLLESMGAALQSCDREADLLERTSRALGPALSAKTVTWDPVATEPTDLQPHEVIVRTADGPRYVLRIGLLAGGRRLLSDDLAMLERVAFLLARRIDAIRLTDERYQRELHDRDLQTLATEAELRALRAQVNPHFLFNALTTIGYLIQTAPPRAVKTLFRLTSLLRTVLRSEGQFTTLGRERELIDDYLSIERERFEERLLVTLNIPEALLDVPIPSLIVQPLVENAIKHGISGARAGGTVTVRARLESGAGEVTLVIQVCNTGAPLRLPVADTGTQVGLRNVRRRLTYHYHGAATLTLVSEPSGATIAELRLPAAAQDDDGVTAAAPGHATW